MTKTTATNLDAEGGQFNTVYYTTIKKKTWVDCMHRSLSPTRRIADRKKSFTH